MTASGRVKTGLVCVPALAAAAVLLAADLESRQLTHYVPQDTLETIVRTEGWTEIPLKVKGGVRKADTVRIWAGGIIDRGNGDRPGQNTAGPDGAGVGKPAGPPALSDDPSLAFCLLAKSETGKPTKCSAPGKPLEIVLSKDDEKVFLGFNDEKGRYMDNHLGRGRRHELDPLWMRIEVVRNTVD
jgi:hypothetical protein